jgi:hypothetical protein
VQLEKTVTQLERQLSDLLFSKDVKKMDSSKLDKVFYVSMQTVVIYGLFKESSSCLLSEQENPNRSANDAHSLTGMFLSFQEDDLESAPEEYLVSVLSGMADYFCLSSGRETEFIQGHFQVILNNLEKRKCLKDSDLRTYKEKLSKMKQAYPETGFLNPLLQI